MTGTSSASKTRARAEARGPASASPRPRRGADASAAAGRRDLYRGLDAIYVERPEDASLAESLEDMVDRTLTGVEGRAVVVAGQSGAGKTTMIERVARTIPELSADASDAGVPGMLAVQVPASCTVADLGTEIARAAGYPLKDGLKASVAWGAAMRQLQNMGIRFLWLDEVTNLADNLNKREARKVRTHIKMALVNRRHRVGLVLSGVDTVLGFLLGDAQVLRRSDVVEIRPLDRRMHGMVAATVRSLAAKAGLDASPDLRRELAPRLAHASLGAFGTCVEMAKSTIQRVVRRREPGGDPKVLTLDDFATHWGRRYGVAADENPFVVDDWERVDCAAVTSRGGIAPPRPAPTTTRSRKVTGGVV